MSPEDQIDIPKKLLHLAIRDAGQAARQLLKGGDGFPAAIAALVATMVSFWYIGMKQQTGEGRPDREDFMQIAKQVVLYMKKHDLMSMGKPDMMKKIWEDPDETTR